MSCGLPKSAAPSRQDVGSSNDGRRGVWRSGLFGLAMVTIATVSPIVRDWALADRSRTIEAGLTESRPPVVAVAPESEYRLRIPSPPSRAWSTEAEWDEALRAPVARDPSVEFTPEAARRRTPGYTSGRFDGSAPHDAPILPVAYGPRSHRDFDNTSSRPTVPAPSP